MDYEYSSLMENHTWDLFHLPKGRKLVWCHWVYCIKYDVDGSIDKYKECLVAKGFSQVEGIDYSKTFSPLVKMSSIHLVLTLVSSKGWTTFQMDVKSTFLHGGLLEEIYMDQPQCSMQDSSLVCKLMEILIWS